MPRIKINYNPLMMTAFHHDCLTLHMNDINPIEVVALASYWDDVRIMQRAFPKAPDSDITALMRDRKRINYVDDEFVLIDIPC